jgi:pyruvate dehydrogenase E2 component (dihydrolipoamide acetyltransferase)
VTDSPQGGARGATETIELSRGEQTVARRVAEARATIPDFSVSAEVDMERCAELRRRLPEPAPTVEDIAVRACALALREHPRANASYRDGKLELHGRINVALAIYVGEGGLALPTVLDADRKPLAAIARETRALAERVRAGTVTPPELAGGTFTVASVAAEGADCATTIITPPQVAALAIGAVRERAAARRTMWCTLSCDHRALNPGAAARLLARIRSLLEEPEALAG